jgi:hypothetical protein
MPYAQAVGPQANNYDTQPNPFQNFGNPASFTAAATTQASDYDTIMKNYQNVIGDAKNNPLTAQTPGFTQSQDVTNSLADLSNLATTGGYTPQNIQDIRARDVSPTRSIYANAQQNVDRSRALGGGYSPNANATQASMARDESSQISDINTNANAGIAQNVASNELAASGAYGSEASGINAQRTGVDQANANRNLEAQIFGKNQVTGAISGEANLYGTTPALTSTFGNQVVQAGQMGQGQQNINNQTQRNLFGYGGGGY